MAAASRLKWIQTTSTGVGQDVKALGIQDSDILITTARGSMPARSPSSYSWRSSPFPWLAPPRERAAGASLGALLR